MRVINDKVYLSPTEAAVVLGLSRRTLMRRITDGPRHRAMLKWFRDPANGYVYLAKDSVDEMVRHIESLTDTGIR